MNFRLSTLAALLAVASMPAMAVTYEDYGTAVLQGLDKVTGRVERFEVPVGGNAPFGKLYVTARACKKTPPEELPESVAFLEIEEIKPGEKGKMWFSGWMFASNPSLAALEHPVYDIGVVDCKKPLANVDASAQTAPVAAVPLAPVPSNNPPANAASTKPALPAIVTSPSLKN